MFDARSDPLKEVRTTKRRALLAALLAICGLLPVYSLLIGLSPIQIGLLLAPLLFSLLLTIELAARWEYRSRRRHAYPHRLAFELAAIRDFGQACRRSAELVAGCLRARAVVVAWLDEEGQALAPVAAFGLPESWTETAPLLSLNAPPLRDALRQRSVVAKPSAEGDPWFGGLRKGDRVVYVPLLSHDGPEGVLAIAADPRNRDTRDRQLLGALGMLMSLAIENCRLYEGGRAHAQHLQQVSRMKSDFLATISHELRTPLTSIKMAAEMLLEDEQGQDPRSPRARLMGNIVRSAARLTGLIGDLVDISREDEFQPRLELDPVPLEDIITNAVAIIQPLVAAKEQTLEVQPPPPGTLVMADRLRFEQVLINLLSNAQRYSPPGGLVKVSSGVEKGEVLIRVADSGPGVAAGDREVIFEPFYRGNRLGLGLGLAIAKSLVELHNGRIWVENDSGQGSTFCVALPMGATKSGSSFASAGVSP